MRVNIDDPNYLQWWEAHDHLSNARAYNDLWDEFFRENPNYSRDQVLEKGRRIMRSFNQVVNY
ncbi:MAG: hypothetical protein KatS3mg015_0002 [Fimbriimonadales bacterium]|nr:MAG: hypothetical protein KatS3mg015_0002 [Fimbriimonadales bacterium]